MICTMSAASRTRSTSSSGITGRRPTMSCELRHRHTGATFVPRAESERLHTRILAQHLGDARSEGARSLAVNDAQALEVSAHGGVQRLHHDIIDVADPLAAQVDLTRGLDFGDIAHDRYGVRWARRLLRRSSERRERKRHLHPANDHDCLGVASLGETADAAGERLDLDEVAFVRLGVLGGEVRVSGVCPTLRAALERGERLAVLGRESLDALPRQASLLLEA